MRCESCGKEIVEGAKFCAFCGDTVNLPKKARQPAPYDVTGKPKPRADSSPYKRPEPEPERAAPRDAENAPPRQMPVRLPDPPPRRDPRPERPRREPERLTGEERRFDGPRPSASERAKPPIKTFLFEGETDEDGLREEEEEREEDRSARKRTFAVVLIVALLCVAGVAYLMIRREPPSTELYLRKAADFAARGEASSAADAYVDAFRYHEGNDAFSVETALRIAQGLETVGTADAYVNAGKIYNYLTSRFPDRAEPYDRAIALYSRLSDAESLDGMTRLRDKNLATPEPTPAPTPTPFVGVRAPVPSKNAGTYAGPIELTFAAEEGAQIHYTLNGATPTAYSPKYTGVIVLESGEYHFRVVAISGNRASEEWVGSYTITSSEPVG